MSELFGDRDTIDILRVVLFTAHDTIKFGSEAAKRRREAAQRALAMQTAIREHVAALRKLVGPTRESA